MLQVEFLCKIAELHKENYEPLKLSLLSGAFQLKDGTLYGNANKLHAFKAPVKDQQPTPTKYERHDQPRRLH